MMRLSSSGSAKARNRVAMIAFAAVAMLGASVADADGRGRPNGGRIKLGACGNTAEASRSAGSGRLFGDGFES